MSTRMSDTDLAAVRVVHGRPWTSWPNLLDDLWRVRDDATNVIADAMSIDNAARLMVLPDLVDELLELRAKVKASHHDMEAASWRRLLKMLDLSQEQCDAKDSTPLIAEVAAAYNNRAKPTPEPGPVTYEAPLTRVEVGARYRTAGGAVVTVIGIAPAVVESAEDEAIIQYDDEFSREKGRVPFHVLSRLPDHTLADRVAALEALGVTTVELHRLLGEAKRRTDELKAFIEGGNSTVSQLVTGIESARAAVQEIGAEVQTTVLATLEARVAALEKARC